MPNFAIISATPLRFTGDFLLVPDSGYQPASAEKTYLDAVNAVVDLMAADAAADTAARYPEALLLARQAERNRRVLELEADARKFIAGHNATADLTRVTAIRNKYTSKIPKFGTKDASSPRFEGDFELVFVLGYRGEEDQAFLDNITKAVDELAADKSGDSTGNFSPSVVTFRENQRKATAKSLRDHVTDFWVGQTPGNVAANNVVLTRGRYQALRDRLKRRLFNVKLTSETKKAEDEDSVSNLDINLLGGLPPPQDAPSSEKQDLYVQIHKANTVIRAVCDRMDERAERGLRAWLRFPNKGAQKRARILHTEFLGKLHGIALVGLELEFTSLAKLALAELRNEFFVLEAGRIKNTYVRWLGAWAGLAGLAFLTVYVIINAKGAQWPWAYDHKNFLLAACGASVGTWASFSIRQVQFSFEDLVMVEESSLDPPVRVLFVFVLTMAACLLFWTGAINIEIGNLKTRPEAFKESGSIALLVGLFAGLSERALATAISGRAAAFVRGIAAAP